MDDVQLEDPLFFARTQLDLVQRQAEAVNKNEFSLARSLTLQLRRSLPVLAKLVQDYQSTSRRDETAREVFALAIQTKDVHEGTLNRLTANRDRLARLLKELRRGQQLVTQYHSGFGNYSFFDING
ncbi:MAG: hypothetical protein V2A61_08145 [Calditrichota bacterium]